MDPEPRRQLAHAVDDGGAAGGRGGQVLRVLELVLLVGGKEGEVLRQDHQLGAAGLGAGDERRRPLQVARDICRGSKLHYSSDERVHDFSVRGRRLAARQARRTHYASECNPVTAG